jgi:hypothetical protein
MTAEPTVTAVRLPVHNNAEWDAAVLVNADAPELRSCIGGPTRGQASGSSSWGWRTRAGTCSSRPTRPATGARTSSPSASPHSIVGGST